MSNITRIKNTELRFLMGLRYPHALTSVSFQGVRDFLGGGREVIFFLEVIHFFGGEGYILKLAFSHYEVLSCIL